MIKQLSTKTVYKNPWMSVREDGVEFANGHKGIYGVVEKSDCVLIIPFDGEKLYLVKQYRYPIANTSIEFVQGKHENDPSGKEDILTLANAELREETGFIAKRLSHIGFMHEAPGAMNQGFHIYFATNLEQKDTNPDVTEEDLEVVAMTPQEVEQSIESGEMKDAPTVAAYGLAKIKKLI